MKYDEKQAIGEGYRELKHYLRKVVFETFKVTIDDTETVEHYFNNTRQNGQLHLQSNGVAI